MKKERVLTKKKEYIPGTFAIVDVETTGTRPLYDRVIDIAVIRVENGAIVRTLNTLLHPGMTIPTHITSINTITNEMIIGAPLFEDTAIQLQEILHDATFVAHNAHFDYGFVKNEFRRIGIEWSAPMLCSVKLSRKLFPSERSHDLDALMYRHDITCASRHRAYPDAKVVHDFLSVLANHATLSKETVCEEIENLLYADTLPPLLHRSVLKNLPDTAGIYFFYGSNHELLYVGKSKNIRTRVRSHFSGLQSPREARLYSAVAYVEAVETHGELSALLLESQTIKTHTPLHNRALRKARSIVTAHQGLSLEGYNTISLSQVSYIDQPEHISALFRTMTQGTSWLRAIAKQSRLCPKLLGVEKTRGACFNYQLGLCDGACIGKENTAIYNKRFKGVFSRRSVKSWPYSGPIMIEEKGKDLNTGTSFIVDEWRLIKSMRYDHGATEEFIVESAFDYDTYKILARYILSSANKRSIKVLSPAEYKQVLGVEEYESEVEYS